MAVDDSNAGDAVTETGVVVGDPSAAGNVLTNDTDVDTGDTRTVTAVNGATANVGAPLVGLYGTLTLLANGSWTYTLNDADPDTNALTQGQAASDAFTYTVSDANGGSSTAALTIAITGANDAPVAVDDGNAGDAVTESGVVVGDPSATGNVLTNDIDPDSGDTKTVTEVNGSAAQRRRAAGRHLRHADAPGRRQLDLYAQRRRSRHQRAGAGSDRHRRRHLHCFRHQRRHLVRVADHHHYRRQRRAGGDRGGGQRRGDGRRRSRCWKWTALSTSATSISTTRTSHRSRRAKPAKSEPLSRT